MMTVIYTMVLTHIEKQVFKLLLVPDAIGVDCQRAFDFLCQQYSTAELDNPSDKSANLLDHSSGHYAEYLQQRLMGKLQVWQGVSSEFEQAKADFVAFAHDDARLNQSTLVLARADSLLLKQPMLPESESAQMTNAYTQYLTYTNTIPKSLIKREVVTLINQKNGISDIMEIYNDN